MLYRGSERNPTGGNACSDNSFGLHRRSGAPVRSIGRMVRGQRRDALAIALPVVLVSLLLLGGVGVAVVVLRERSDAQKNDREVAELTRADVTATVDDRSTTYDMVRQMAEQVFIPLTVGGGVRSSDDVARLLGHGADKIGVNSAAIARPELIAEIAARFGAQVCVLSLDVKRSDRTASGFVVTTHGGRTSAGLDAVAWARRASELGAGEILLNAMDADGTQDGFDLELIRAVRREVTIPVIASGGAGHVDHFPPAVEAGADAVLAATVFHFGTLRIAEVKHTLEQAGHPVRTTPL